MNPISQVSNAASHGTSKADFSTLRTANPKFDAMIARDAGLKKKLEAYAATGKIAGAQEGPAFPVEFNYWGHSPATLHDKSEEQIFDKQYVFIWQKVQGGPTLDFDANDREAGAKLLAVFHIGDLVSDGTLKVKKNAQGFTDAAVGDGIQFRVDIKAFGKPGADVRIGFANGLVEKNGDVNFLGRGGGYMREYAVKAGPGAVYPIDGNNDYERFDDAGKLVAYKG